MRFVQSVKRHLGVGMLRARARAAGIDPGSFAKAEAYLATCVGLGQARTAHPLQRPRHYFPGLTARPWHDTAEVPWIGDLERAGARIREEFTQLSEPCFEPALTGDHERGDWNIYYLYVNGRKVPENCARCPETAKAIEAVPRLASEGLIFFSVLTPGTHILAHCGDTNTRLRCHLGVIVQEGSRIRVGSETRSWQENKCLLFDDSFDHEVWISQTGPRVVLVIDIWHPELTEAEVWALEQIMQMSRRTREFNRYVLDRARGTGNRERIRRKHFGRSLD